MLAAIERIVAPLGRRIDESSPMVDARLEDGSRVNAVIPPLALRGPSLTIRKFTKHKLTARGPAGFGSINEPMLEFLQMAVKQRKNIVISGGTGIGKTTLLNILSNFIPDDERIVTIEDAAELKLSQPHLVVAGVASANLEGKGEITIRELVRNCPAHAPGPYRRRRVPWRRGAGHAAGHEHRPRRLADHGPRQFAARRPVAPGGDGADGGHGPAGTAVREQIASAVGPDRAAAPLPCGSRKVTRICEMTGIESGTIQTQDIFLYRATGSTPRAAWWALRATGRCPEFYEELRERGCRST